MKILFVTSNYKPEGNALASRVSGMAEEWVKQGCDVTILAPTPKKPSGEIFEGYKNKWTHVETINGVKVIRKKTYIVAEKDSTKKILSHIAFMIVAFFSVWTMPKYDVIITTTPAFFPAWITVPLSYLKKAVYIVEYRDPWVDGFKSLNIKLPSFFIQILFYMEKLLLKRADHIVTVGEGYKVFLQKKEVPADKISVIMNGVDEEIFFQREKEQSILDKYRLNGKFVCAYIGTLGYSCGLFPMIVKAAEMLKASSNDKIVLLVVGDGIIFEELKREKEEKGLDNLVLTGYVNKKEIPSFLSIIDVSLVHLRNVENVDILLPSKIFESAAMHKPILVGVPGFAESLVLTAKAGMTIRQESPESLYEKLIYLSSHLDECKSYGDNAFNNIAKNNSRKNKALAYLDLMNRLHSGIQTPQ